MNHAPGNIKSRKIAILVANGVDGAAIDAFKAKLAEQGALADDVQVAGRSLEDVFLELTGRELRT